MIKTLEQVFKCFESFFVNQKKKKRLKNKIKNEKEEKLREYQVSYKNLKERKLR